MTKAKRWKPKEGETYFYIVMSVVDMAAIRAWEWRNDSVDKYCFRSGNCFQTKREAQAVARKLKGFWKNVREGKDDRGKSVSFNRDS